MSNLQALLVLALLGLVFGPLAFRHELDGDEAMILAVATTLLLPMIGAAQHFLLGWPWWPIVIPAHAVTAIAGVFWFGRDSSSPTEDL